jgi:nucleotide-binding universal stress UspA family protein
MLPSTPGLSGSVCPTVEGGFMGVIVVGYIPKPEGKAALRVAIAEAKLRDARLIVVNSKRRYDAEPGRGDESDSYLDDIQRQLDEQGLSSEVRQVIRAHEPGDDLTDIAVAESADLIVIGLRRRTPIGKLILGSNAQRILLDAPCPVLAVKAEPGE